MTIGIAASGPNAGLAVFRALAAVEKVASGSVGGFAAFACIGQDSKVYRAETQRGGTATLFTQGEITGVLPPSHVATARVAGVMSSGPDRPAPLSQFVLCNGTALVTGHRLPNGITITGRPLNLEVMNRLAQGCSARESVCQVLQADPEVDAGVIAVDRYGAVYACNSERVQQRPDLGRARREDQEGKAVIEILHNAIEPARSIAAVAADIGLAEMASEQEPVISVLVRSGIPVTRAPENRLLVNPDGEAIGVETTDARILTGTHNCAAIFLGSAVVCNDEVIGHTRFEPNTVVENGRIKTLNNRTRMEISYQAESGM